MHDKETKTVKFEGFPDEADGFFIPEYAYLYLFGGKIPFEENGHRFKDMVARKLTKEQAIVFMRHCINRLNSL